LIHLYKYARVKTLASPLSDLLVAALPREERFDAITPVPLHWMRQWRRGFNQSELLAHEIARRSGIPLLPALRRVRPTHAQAGLSNTGRRRNVTAAFSCTRPGRSALEGKRILLVDDVMTTGATGAACALVLKRAGAKRVALLTVGRVDKRVPAARAAAQSTDRGG
jgi:ComF family protein